MKFASNVLLRLFLGVNVCTVLSVSASVIQNRVTSDNAIAARAKGLENLAKHVKADTCWKVKASAPWKLGDFVTVGGTEYGRLPSTCVYSPQTQQFLQVSYLDGELQVTQVYSRKEVRNQLSIKGEK
ncbi:hypothetical protein NIES2100_73750 [Calothrix sp. NIES-2100]|uniref:hypothetical protein n=1 Tax=Calothrix sp. NIES-2100 TaxID=1954172 RepID=UPI000B5DFCC4|nr:hypothetical protein NIES2100_73750 [Calothrix sp. NIES-2100]